MPFMIAPMACSRMPKCSTRPASGSAFHILVARSPGRNDGAPSMVVLFDSARSAEPPQSSGSCPAIALITLLEALRVAIPFSSAGNDGRWSAQPSGRLRGWSRSNSATPAAGLRDHPPHAPLAAPRGAPPLPLAGRAVAALDGPAGVLEDPGRHLEGLLGVEAEHLLGGGHL